MSSELGHGPRTSRRSELDEIPRAVVYGYEAGHDAHSLEELEARLGLVKPEHLGFAYEGATMALTVQAPFGDGRTLRRFLEGPALPHRYLCYIGIGFAMAKLPRALWPRMIPHSLDLPDYPQLSWLAVDGYGFDLAYFGPERWVERQRPVTPWPWFDRPEYFCRAADQGIGRALWFRAGGEAIRVAHEVARFPAHRSADLWSGVGLAAAFAGPEGGAEFQELGARAGARAPDLRLGVALACRARILSGTVPCHTAQATSAILGMSVEQAYQVTEKARPAADGRWLPVPDYETWRTGIRARLANVVSPLRDAPR